MTNRHILIALPAAIAACLPAFGAASKTAAASANANVPANKQRPNILFIICDDMRPEMGCYGYTAAITPNIDRLAASGVQFTRAYCQEALSGPSRASLFSGYRPSKSGYIDNDIRFRTVMPDVVTMPEFFGNNGYATVRLGKIFHEGDKEQMESAFNTKAAMPEFPRSADSDFKNPETKKEMSDVRKQMLDKFGPVGVGALSMGPVAEFWDAPDEEYHDGYITTSALATMKAITAQGKNFFIGVGYKKPHLSFIAPKKYWDMYEGRAIPIAQDSLPPKGAPAIALHDSFELRTRSDVPKYGPFSDDYQRYLMRSYLSCVTFVDAQLGRLIAGLKEQGLADNTIIVFCGDHGWHLGEMGVWGKATNYEIAARVPLLIIDPRIGKKGKCNSVVEFLDLYPTLADLAGFPIPSNLQGHSIKDLLEHPSKTGDAVAINQFPCPALREWAGVKTDPNVRKAFFDRSLTEIENRIAIENPDTPLSVFQKDVIGYSIRDNRYRCTAWVDQSAKPWRVITAELYDQEKDPLETVNIAVTGGPDGKAPASSKAIVDRLEAQMWKVLGFENNF